jgi:hypothetical protein
MSKRVLTPSLLGVAVIGGVTAGGLAMASTATQPALEKSAARYIAPAGSRTGSLTFTTDVRDDSGVRGLKVLAWPASSELDPTEAEMREVESATCRGTTGESSRCTYTLKVTSKKAAELEQGTWYVSALATAGDGGTVFLPRAAAFELAR